MKKEDIVYALSNGGKQQFITKEQIAECMGIDRRTVFRHIKDMGVNSINGKYYYVREVADGYARRLEG